jgi:hypothetical protein
MTDTIRLPFRVIDANEAAQFRAVTAGRDNQLDPRRILAGPLVGRFAIPENVMFDAAFSDIHDLLRVAAPEVSFVEVEAAWPVVEEVVEEGEA